MGAQEKSSNSNNPMQRVKVYRLNDDGKWDDQGTGHVTVDYIERSEDLGLLVADEEDHETLLLHRISADDIYRKQEDTIISWKDPEYQTELALSFQETTGCSYIWDHICSVQRNMHFSSLNNETFHSVNSDLKELPPVELSTLPLILKTVVEGGIADQLRVTELILQDQDFFRKLMDLFRISEDLENYENLHIIFKIVRGIMMLNCTQIFEKIFGDELIIDIIGCLEYDPDAPHVHHRNFLREHVVFKEAISIKDPIVLSKIHQTYRVGYLKDAILPRVLDDAIVANLNSIIHSNNAVVVSLLKDDSTFIQDLLGKLKLPSTSAESKKNLVHFLHEFCSLSKSLQVVQQHRLFRDLVNEGIFDIVADVLESQDKKLVLTGTDILILFLNQDPNLLRSHVIRQEGLALFGLLVKGMLTDFEDDMHCQFLEILRSLLDSYASGSQRETIVEIFYEKHLIQLIDVITSSCPTDIITQTVSNSESSDGGTGKQSSVKPEILLNICDLLCFCIVHHPYRIKCNFLLNNVIDKVLFLTRRKEKYLVVAAVRFMRTLISRNVGNEERIHVYYAHGEDNTTFVRRCYWLLDKTLEHIVLVHYRETQEVSSNNTVAKSSPAAPVSSGSALSDPADQSASWVLSGELDSAIDQQYSASRHAHLEPNRDMTVQNHEQRLLEINTLEWDELLATGSDPNKIIATQQAGGKTANVHHTLYEQHNLYELNGYSLNGVSSSLERMSTVNNSNEITFQTMDGQMTSSFEQNESGVMTVSTGDSLDSLNKDRLETQDSFGRWMNYLIIDSPGSTDDPTPESSVSTGQSYAREQIFNITEISPDWASSTEETKIFIIGHFHGEQSHPESSSLHCVCGDACFPAEFLQPGVYRCIVPPQTPGLVNIYLSFDGNKPISQVMSFEFRAPSVHVCTDPPENKCDWDEFRIQTRLAHLLFSTSMSLNILSSKIHQDLLKDAKTFAGKCSRIIDDWACLIKSIEDKKFSVPHVKDCLFELSLKTRLQEWLLERIVEGCKISEHDEQGQGVIHLCAILGYTWAIYPFSWSGLSLDYRDKYGWTALHWAAYYGREIMVATLLSAGAKANLVTDPTSENLGGCTASDLASKNGHEGLGAYLAEKALVAQFKDMKLAGNISGSLQTTTESINPGNFTEEELNLKDSLAAYRTAAAAAARIQAAFRERALKVQTKAVESSNPEMDARNIIAAMKIQHAFRNYEMQKQLAAAARIQYRFRTWKIRKEFLHMRRQAIKIQAVFRGFQVRRQYRKIIWSVGVLEKALFRWRLKRKGFRGLKLQSSQVVNQKPDDIEEDFFQASRKQAEERIERSVVRVQAMFRSKQAQEEYRRMKLEHNKATLEYEGTFNADTEMD